MEMFDFTSLQEPRLPVKLGYKDGEGRLQNVQVLNVKAVDVALMKRLLATAQELKATKTHDEKYILRVFDIVADVLSCNDEQVVITGAQLHDTYKMSFVAAVKFVGAYMAFVNEVAAAKN